jgi:hypothetical protein
MIVRRNLSSIPFVPLVLALMLPACFTPPTVDPGPRVIADFNEGTGVDGSTWSAFGAWECTATATIQADGGSDDITQPSSPDGGPPTSCRLGPGDGDRGSLTASFALDAATGGQKLAVAVGTHTPTGAPVNLTGFNKLFFSAWLQSSTSTIKLPLGTGLKVQLGCTTNMGDISVDQSVIITPDAPDWSVVAPLLLTGFQGKNPLTSPVGACLAVVDSISFVVSFGSTPDPIAGTLWLDNIELK